MSVKLIGTTSGVEVNSNTDGALQVEIRGAAIGSLGVYQVTVPSGAIAATLAAGSTLFSFRWTDATRLALIKVITVSAVVTSAITTAVPFDLEAVVARSFTASDSGGTAISLSGNNNKLRTSFGTSLVGDARVAATAALTTGTRTLDAQAIGRVQGFTGTALGTQVFGTVNGANNLVDRSEPGRYPLTLAQNEGIIIRNPLAGPATGTITLLISIEWQEVAAY